MCCQCNNTICYSIKFQLKKTRYIDSLFTLVKNYPLQVIDKNILSSVHPIYNKTFKKC